MRASASSTTGIHSDCVAVDLGAGACFWDKFRPGWAHIASAPRETEGAHAMKLSLYAVLIGISLVALPDSASAEGGFLSGLNPFNYTRQKKAPVSARAGDSSWKMPRLWPGGGNTRVIEVVAPFGRARS
jgi:hypothetical protein